MGHVYRGDKITWYVAPLYGSADVYHAEQYGANLQARLAGVTHPGGGFSFSSVIVRAVANNILVGSSGSLSVTVIAAQEFGDAADVSGLIAGAAHAVSFGFDNSKIVYGHDSASSQGGTSTGSIPSWLQSLYQLGQAGASSPSHPSTQTSYSPSPGAPSPSPSQTVQLPNGQVVLISGKYQSTDFLKKYGGWLAVGVAAMFLLSMTGRR